MEHKQKNSTDEQIKSKSVFSCPRGQAPVFSQEVKRCKPSAGVIDFLWKGREKEYHKEYDKNYYQVYKKIKPRTESARVKDYRKIYRQSPEYRISKKRWASSDKGRISQKKWRQSLKGRLYVKMLDSSRRLKEKGLNIKTIQQVYEDNINYFGTLTCYLCLLPIPFGKDHLEHKMPLSKGGTNIKTNLGIACMRCNCSKGKKTVSEFLAKEGIAQPGRIF